MKNRVFLDTNILIYALTKPKVAEDIYKRDIAIKLLENLIQQNDIYISIQILNEVHVNLVKKFKIDDEKVFKTIKDNILAIASVNDMSFQTYQRAFKLRKKIQHILLGLFSCILIY
jgi:predicted nucleic acid-binding protein